MKCFFIQYVMRLWRILHWIFLRLLGVQIEQISGVYLDTSGVFTVPDSNVAVEYLKSNVPFSVDLYLKPHLNIWFVIFWSV